MNKTIFITAIFLSFGLTVFSQKDYSTSSKKAIKLYETALQLLAERDNQKAIEKLKSSIEADSRFIEAYLTLADVYHNLDDIENEIINYRKGLVISPTFFKSGYYNLGKAEFGMGYYEEARESFQTFLSFKNVKLASRVKAEQYIRSCNFAIEAMKNPVPFKPVNLGQNINTPNDEYFPALTADGKTLVFTTLVNEKPSNPEKKPILQEDFFMSEFENGTWTKATKIDEVNTPGNEGAQCISSDGKMMFYTACSRRDGLGRCDIYYSLFVNGEWSTPRNIGPPVNSDAWESQPAISPDGKTLYFASNRKGGKGKMDIWKSTLSKDGRFGEPVNLGETINTTEDESSPFIHADNSTMYFSSNGRTGMGGYDLYKSTFIYSEKWSEPVNLGYPINTFNDEKGLIVNSRGDKAYFSSNRLGENGEDLYVFDLHEEARPTSASYVKGRVFDVYTKTGLVANFELINLSTDETVMESYSHEPKGEFLVTLPIHSNYALNVSKPGYLFFSENFALDTVSGYVNPFEIDIPLHPILVGEKIILRNIFFETDSYQLKEESKTELQKIIEFMQNNPRLAAEISGHTDDVGNGFYNQDLSEKRAEAVVNYLIQNSISQNRLKFAGYGEDNPIDTNETEEGRANNRRTEFKVIGK